MNIIMNNLNLSINIDLNNLDNEDFLYICNFFQKNIFEKDNKLKFKDIDCLFNLSNRQYQTTSVEYPEINTYNPHSQKIKTTKFEIKG